MSIQEIKAHLLDAMDCLPRAPLARAAQDFDEQIARLRALMAGSGDESLMSTIAQLEHSREQCNDLLGAIHVVTDNVTEYAGRI